MNYWQYHIRTDTETAEILMAFLGEAPFDTFEEGPDGMLAFLPDEAGNAQQAEDLLNALQDQFSFDWEKKYIAAQNWNELWESNFQPVVVNDFCAVRADFHPHFPNVRHELNIQPRMAFGTGHHETTWMCMAAMEHLPIEGKTLLDYGCGTGILAILASKLGAKEIEAVDIEEESYQNTLDNAVANDVHNIIARCGTLENVEGTAFHGILANINRNIILDSLSRLHQLLLPGGWLLCSGFILSDHDRMVEAAKAEGFRLLAEYQKGNWNCLLFEMGVGSQVSGVGPA